MFGDRVRRRGTVGSVHSTPDHSAPAHGGHGEYDRKYHHGWDERGPGEKINGRGTSQSRSGTGRAGINPGHTLTSAASGWFLKDFCLTGIVGLPQYSYVLIKAFMMWEL